MTLIEPTSPAKKRRMKPGGIYTITCKVSRVVYVGSAKDLTKRFGVHCKLLTTQKHFNRHLQNAWNLYGAAEFEYAVISVLGPYNKDEYFAKENEVILEMKSQGQELYNIAKAQGGWGEDTKARADEISKKISDSLKVMYAKLTPEERKQKHTSWIGTTNENHRAATAAGMLGLKRTEENKKNISAGLKGHPSLQKAGREHGYKNLSKKGDVPPNAKTITVDGEAFSSIYQACAARVVTPKLIAHLQNPNKNPCPARFRKNGIPNVTIA